MTRNPIAVQLYTLRQQCAADFPGTLRAVAEIGFGAVEVAGFHGMTAAGLHSHLQALGLRVAGSHVALETLESEFDRVIDDHRTITSPYLIVPWLAPEIRQTATDWDRIAGRLEVLAERCHREGMGLAYHHHQFELEPIQGQVTADTGLAHLFFHPAKTSYQAELDVYWAQYAGVDPAGLIRRLTGRCPLLHMKDMARDEARSFAEVGEGQLDWPAILAAAQEAGVEWLIVEQDVCPREPLDCIRTSFGNLNRMLAEKVEGRQT